VLTVRSNHGVTTRCCNSKRVPDSDNTTVQHSTTTQQCSTAVQQPTVTTRCCNCRVTTEGINPAV
jgi:hypothetical protein